MTAVVANPEILGLRFLAFTAETAEKTEPALEEHGAAAALSYGIVFSRGLRLRNDLASLAVTFRTFHNLFLLIFRCSATGPPPVSFGRTCILSSLLHIIQ